MYLYLGLPCTRVRHMHTLDMACYRGRKRTPRAPGTERPARWSRMQRLRNDGGRHRHAERGGDEGGGERSGTREGGRRPQPHPNPHPHPHPSRLLHAVADAATTPSSSAAAVAAPRSPPPPSRPPAPPPSLPPSALPHAAAGGPHRQERHRHRVADRRGEAPAVVVEVKASAGGHRLWSVHEREAHAWW